MSTLRTEFPFRLPKGFVDADGTVHHDGTMRLATARDELDPLGDPKVRDADDPYLSVIVLSRVITRLGPATNLSPKDVEGLFAADLAYLQDVYATINYGTQAELDRFLANRGQPAPAASVLQDDAAAATATAAPAVPVAAEGANDQGSRTPISDAARSIVADVPKPVTHDVPSSDVEPEAGDQIPASTHAPRRTRIEEVGRSSGRPR